MTRFSERRGAAVDAARSLRAAMPPRPGKRQSTTSNTRLAKRRVACGVNLDEMAHVCGVAPRTYWKLEHGKIESAPLWLLNNCALALGVRMEDIIEPEWRVWCDRYGDQPSPPDPDEFWRLNPDS